MILHKYVTQSELPPNQSAQLRLGGLYEYTLERDSLTLHEIIQNILNYADKHNLYIDYYPGCAEHGYDDVPILAANWNTPGIYEVKHGLAERYNRTAKIGKWLSWYESNHGGISLEWSDEWTSCSICGKAIRTSPTSYSWTSSFVMTECDIICRECWSDELDNIIPEYTSNYHNGFHSKALPPEFTDLLEANGFTCWQPSSEECTIYETGWHAHQTDDPKKVYDEIMADSHSWEICFIIVGVGQFDVDWTAYVRRIEEE